MTSKDFVGQTDATELLPFSIIIIFKNDIFCRYRPENENGVHLREW